jgi:rhodanese-related sulfurtransferase
MLNIDAQAFEKKISDPEVIILDVRTPEEFKPAHILNARNLDIYSPYFSADINGLDKTKPYAVYCRSGQRSQNACQMMAESGFSNTFNLTGGITAWIEANKATHN